MGTKNGGRYAPRFSLAYVCEARPSSEIGSAMASQSAVGSDSGTIGGIDGITSSSR